MSDNQTQILLDYSTLEFTTLTYPTLLKPNLPYPTQTPTRQGLYPIFEQGGIVLIFADRECWAGRYTEKQSTKPGAPAVAPGVREGGRELESGSWKGSTGETVEREEQPALMPPLGHYRRPASNRAGCSQRFQGRFLGTLSKGAFHGHFPRLLSVDSFQKVFPETLSKDAFQDCFLGTLSRGTAF